MLYYLEVIQNVHHLDARLIGYHRFAIAKWTIFIFHTILFCLLLVASFTDFDHQTIPLPLTITGTAFGLIGTVLFAWPWPYSPLDIVRTMPVTQSWFLGSTNLFKAGLYPWPVWWPLPGLLAPGGNWQTGLATGFMGLLVGTLMLRAVRFVFGLGMGAAYMDPADGDPDAKASWFGRRWLSWLQRVGGRALGLGDADLMMMAGSFLGWQPVAVAFLIGVFPGLVFGLGQLFLRGNHPLPFGPALAIGTMITCLGWTWIGPRFQPLFFDGTLMVILGITSFFFMLMAGYMLRMLRINRS